MIKISHFIKGNRSLVTAENEKTMLKDSSEKTRLLMLFSGS